MKPAAPLCSGMNTNGGALGGAPTPMWIMVGINASLAASSLAGLRYRSIRALRVPRSVSATVSNGALATPPIMPGQP